MGLKQIIIQYYENPGESFSCFLFEDYKNEEVKLVEVVPEDFIEATISNLYEDKDTGEETWWRAEVADVDIDSEDMLNPEFYVMYYVMC